MPKTVSLSDELYSQIADRVEKTDFDTVDAYAQYVLEQVVAKASEQESDLGVSTNTDDEENVKERLKGLGYLE